MGVKCVLRHIIGEQHEAIITKLEGNHCHVHRIDISKEEREKHDFDKYENKEFICDACGQKFISENAAFGSRDIFDTEDGKIHPGDMYFSNRHYEGKCFHWDNCKEDHLIAILPNGHECDIDGRACNCDMPNDRQHRCWCRHGEPPNITVDKNGNTCHAGAGSILSGNYHGFLRNGEFTEV